MRKFDALRIISENPNHDAASLAGLTGSTPEAAGMFLLRLSRQGLVERTIDRDSGIFFYSLTKKGSGRLIYLHSNSKKGGSNSATETQI